MSLEQTVANAGKESHQTSANVTAERMAWVPQLHMEKYYLDKVLDQDHAVKNAGKVRAQTCGTKSPNRSGALRFIDSAKSPSTGGSAPDRLDDLVP